MTDDRRIELEVEVAGTPDEVWRAIATGPGISSWYVPHVVEEREGGAAHASFGDGPEMQIPGVVAAWEPPHRIVFTGVERGVGLAFEWLVEARDGGSCVVRLVNSGFGTGEEWDAQYDAMKEGWRLFLLNLRLHLAHFPGRDATSMLPMAMWPGTQLEVWERLAAALGLAAEPTVGQRVRLAAGADGPVLAGTVVEAASWRLALLVDEPAPGTAFVAAEAVGPAVGVSVWAYLYGDEAPALTARDKPRWQAWLEGAAQAAANPT